jgi:hypothetical protein
LGKAGRGAGLTLIGARNVGCGEGTRVLGGVGDDGAGAGACRGAGATLLICGDGGPGAGGGGGWTARWLVVTGAVDGSGGGALGDLPASTGWGHSIKPATAAPTTVAAASSSDRRRFGGWALDTIVRAAGESVVVVSPATGSNRYSNRSEGYSPAIPR